jgi:hypothetical protein
MPNKGIQRIGHKTSLPLIPGVIHQKKTMLRVFPKITLMLAVGIGLGFVFSSKPALQLCGLANRITNNDSWITFDGMGSKDADPLLRALVARVGIFANSKYKAVYFYGYVEN